MQEELEVDNNNFIAIPNELKGLKQWFCYKILKKGKVPFDIKTGHESDFSKLFNFEECTYKVNMGFYHGLGFYLDDTRKYSVISLNGSNIDLTFIQKFEEIIRTIDSYTETSVSGKDFKIFVRGNVEKNIITGKEIEIFTSNCPIYLTGNSIRKPVIVDSQGYLNQIYKEIDGQGKIIKFIDIEPQKVFEDHEIIKKIKASSDSEPFLAFKNGFLGDCLNLASAENELIKIILKHTKNKEQICSIISETKIFDDQKGGAYYYDKIKMFLQDSSNANDLIEAKSAVKEEIKADSIRISKQKQMKLEEQIKETKANIDVNEIAIEEEYNLQEDYKEEIKSKIILPGGRMRELIDFFLGQSVLPVPEISLCGALGMVSFIAGKTFKVSGTGLNQYILLLAKTSVGKSEIENGTYKMFKEIYPNENQIYKFLGPEEIGSGQGLIKYISENDCFGVISGEFFDMTRRIASSKASSADRSLNTQLLKMYTKSNAGVQVRETAYSDKTKNTKIVNSPSFSVVGECNPKDFYGSIDERMVTSGLIGRFSIIPFYGERGEESETFLDYKPDQKLVDWMTNLAIKCLKFNKAEKYETVEYSVQTTEFYREMASSIRDLINKAEQNGSEVAASLWGRFAMKVRKMSACLAVMENINKPVITLEQAKWAYDMQHYITNDIIEKFTRGEIGQSDDGQQVAEVKKAVYFYLAGDDFKNYRVNIKLRKEGIIGYTFISQRVSGLKCFKDAKPNTNLAIKNALKHFIDCGDIKELTLSEVKKLGVNHGLFYKVINRNHFRGK